MASIACFIKFLYLLLGDSLKLSQQESQYLVAISGSSMTMLAVLPSGRPDTGASVQESVPEAAWGVQWAAGPSAAGPPL